jgi:hypothetical protein
MTKPSVKPRQYCDAAFSGFTSRASPAARSCRHPCKQAPRRRETSTAASLTPRSEVSSTDGPGPCGKVDAAVRPDRQPFAQIRALLFRQEPAIVEGRPLPAQEGHPVVVEVRKDHIRLDRRDAGFGHRIGFARKAAAGSAPPGSMWPHPGSGRPPSAGEVGGVQDDARSLG